jgi:hypothetical protein
LESDNIFISATQEMKYLFQKLTQVHRHYCYIVVMIVFVQISLQLRNYRYLEFFMLRLHS